MTSRYFNNPNLVSVRAPVPDNVFIPATPGTGPTPMTPPVTTTTTTTTDYGRPSRKRPIPTIWKPRKKVKVMPWSDMISDSGLLTRFTKPSSARPLGQRFSDLCKSQEMIDAYFGPIRSEEDAEEEESAGRIRRGFQIGPGLPDDFVAEGDAAMDNVHVIDRDALSEEKAQQYKIDRDSAVSDASNHLRREIMIYLSKLETPIFQFTERLASAFGPSYQADDFIWVFPQDIINLSRKDPVLARHQTYSVPDFAQELMKMFAQQFLHEDPYAFGTLLRYIQEFLTLLKSDLQDTSRSLGDETGPSSPGGKGGLVLRRQPGKGESPKKASSQPPGGIQPVPFNLPPSSTASQPGSTTVSDKTIQRAKGPSPATPSKKPPPRTPEPGEPSPSPAGGPSTSSGEESPTVDDETIFEYLRGLPEEVDFKGFTEEQVSAIRNTVLKTWILGFDRLFRPDQRKVVFKQQADKTMPLGLLLLKPSVRGMIRDAHMAINTEAQKDFSVEELMYSPGIVGYFTRLIAILQGIGNLTMGYSMGLNNPNILGDVLERSNHQGPINIYNSAKPKHNTEFLVNERLAAIATFRKVIRVVHPDGKTELFYTAPLGQSSTGISSYGSSLNVSMPQSFGASQRKANMLAITASESARTFITSKRQW